MLEKIGLPAKPSLRGNNWVVDASHCQGCSSQFTFINRKHHCRRCGGIFCGTCTQQRMVLRGQGDSPVRICDPCKKLEEAARFELRHGHRGRAGKGSSSRTTDSSNEDDILASDVKGSSSSRTASITTASSTGKPSRMGSSNSPADLYVDETRGSSSMDETVSATPEDLRQQAMDEKKKYKILKGEGKNEEALKAFKRGKELERQAHALEMDLRKSRKKVSSSGGDNKGQNIVAAEGSQRLRNQVPKDDLMSELKLMGWSDKDLENEGKKSKNVSVEGELLALIGEVSNKKKPDENYSGAKAEIAAHKRKAILLKKEGKIGEAKEELKKAKILERQAEEEELLGGAEDSDDEFADLIRSMDSQKEDLNGMSSMQDFDMGLILPDIDNLGEGNFEVTEDDMEDPELAGALQSLGWTEEPKVVVGSKSSGGVIPLENEASYNGAAARVSDLKRESYLPSARRKTKAELQRELLGLKRKAFGLRREGKADEAEEVQKMAKALEDQIAELDVLKKMPVEHIDVVENSEEIDDTEVTENDLQDPALLGMLNDLGWEDHGGRPSSQTVVTVSSSKVAAPRSKAIVQREVLGLKRKALELRRKGEMAEAEEVSNKAKVLQAELEELDAPKEDIPPNNNGTADNKSGGITESSSVKKAPTEEDGSVVIKGGMATENADLVIKAVGMNSAAEVVHRSPVKQEISDHKKRALALKREGKLAEAKEELIKAKLLERSLDEGVGDNNPEPTVSLSSSSATTSTSILQEKERDHPDASLPTPQPSSSPSISMPSMPAPPSKPLSSRERFKIQQESLSHKRQAMKLRREGKMQEAEAEFELAKALEAQLEEHDSSTQSNSEDVDDVMVEDFLDPQLLSALKLIGIGGGGGGGGGGNDNGASTSTGKPVAAAAAAPGKVVSSAGGSTEERVQLEEEIKAEKVKALRLKRAGKQKDALEALKRAKLLERKLSEFH